MDRVQNSAQENDAVVDSPNDDGDDGAEDNHASTEAPATKRQTAGSGDNNVNNLEGNLFQKSSTQPNYNNVNGSSGSRTSQNYNNNYRKNNSKDNVNTNYNKASGSGNRIETGYEFKYPHEKYSKAANWMAAGEHPDDRDWHKRSHERVRRATRPKEENKNTCSLYIQTDPLIWRHIRDSIADVSIYVCIDLGCILILILPPDVERGDFCCNFLMRKQFPPGSIKRCQGLHGFFPNPHFDVNRLSDKVVNRN